MRIASPTASSKQSLSKNLIIGFAAIASAAVVGTVGMAGAMTPNQNNNEARKAFCKNWSDHKDENNKPKYKNHGKCVSDWNSQHKPGHTYPSPNANVKVDTQVGIKVKGNDIHGNNNDDNDNDNNIVVNIWNFIVGG